MLGFYESAEFSAQRDRLGLDCQRLDEMLEGLTFAIFLDPDRFPTIEPDSNVQIGLTRMPRPHAADHTGEHRTWSSMSATTRSNPRRNEISVAGFSPYSGRPRPTPVRRRAARPRHGDRPHPVEFPGHISTW